MWTATWTVRQIFPLCKKICCIRRNVVLIYVRQFHNRLKLAGESALREGAAANNCLLTNPGEFRKDAEGANRVFSANLSGKRTGRLF